MSNSDYMKKVLALQDMVREFMNAVDDDEVLHDDLVEAVQEYVDEIQFNLQQVHSLFEDGL